MECGGTRNWAICRSDENPPSSRPASNEEKELEKTADMVFLK
jgi:hypothetical protein